MQGEKPKKMKTENAGCSWRRWENGANRGREERGPQLHNGDTPRAVPALSDRAPLCGPNGGLGEREREANPTLADLS